MRVLLICLISMSLLACCADNKQTKYNSPKASSTVESSSTNDRLLKNIHGIIIEKHDNQQREEYFFTIKLSNDKVFDWETTRAKYSAKDVGDAVFFEFIRKDRFSDKALD